MTEKSLRGTGLGGSSYESDQGVRLVARQISRYLCPQGHRIEVPFAEAVPVPIIWECPRCGDEALREGADAPVKAAPRPVRTHWDMLLERRSIHELQLLLEERLALLRGEERRSA
jgi:ribosomal protein L37AE/L43A